MASVNITIGNSLNESLSVNDIAYKANLGAASGGVQSASSTDIVKLGTITHIHRNAVNGFTLNGSNVSVPANTITVDVANASIQTNGMVPTNKSMLLFSKDNIVETSGLTGYFAEVLMKNSSTTEAELFSVSSEVVLSSK